MLIGDGGPAADGVVTVTGSDARLSLVGVGTLIVVGDDEATGRLEVRDGGTAYYRRLVLGANGYTNLPEIGAAAVDDDAATNEILATLPDDAAAGGEVRQQTKSPRKRRTRKKRPRRVPAKPVKTPRSRRRSLHVRDNCGAVRPE